MNLQESIAAQRAAMENPPSEDVDVVINGAVYTVTVAKLAPNDWQTLVGKHYPRPGVQSDLNVGYDQHNLPRDYPLDRLKVDGEPVDVETWQDLYDVVDSVHKNSIAATMFGLNVLEAAKELGRLGKAPARSGSPANRASRRAGTKGGNPQK